jgi:hypothetical protein
MTLRLLVWVVFIGTMHSQTIPNDRNVSQPTNDSPSARAAVPDISFSNPASFRAGTAAKFSTASQTANQPAAGGVQTRLNLAYPSLNVGSAETPITGLSYSSPLFSGTVYDASSGRMDPGCGGNTGVGLGAPISVQQICMIESNKNGTPATVPFYSYLEVAPGFRGFAGGHSSNVRAMKGSTPQQIFQNLDIEDLSGWDLVSCSRSSNVITFNLDTTPGPVTLPVGAGFWVSGNTKCSSGQNYVYVATSVSGSTVIAKSNGPNFVATRGGHVAANIHQVWSLEANLHNYSFDPGPIRFFLGQNVQPHWGITSTQQGDFPSTAAFFADGGWYTGLFIPDVLDRAIIIGNPANSTPLKMAESIHIGPQALASASTNFCSIPMTMTSSFYSGSSHNERAIAMRSCIDTVGTPTEMMQILDNGGKVRARFLSDQILVNPSLPSAPNIATVGNRNSGFYVSADGSAGISVNGSNKLNVESSGISIGGGSVIASSNALPQVNTPLVNKAACIKSVGPPIVIGYCSTAVSSTGDCTCN